MTMTLVGELKFILDLPARVSKYFMDKDYIFKRISEKCNYIDPKLAKDMYYGTIKAIISELRKNGKVTLPDFGRFKIHDYKSKSLIDINTGLKRTIPETKIMIFEVSGKLKSYIKTTFK